MKYKILMLLVIITTFVSCNKLAELISFNINAQTSIQVNSTTIINTPFEITTPGITTNSSQEYENNHTTPNLIKEVILEEVKLSVTNPQDKTFSFMKNIHIYISTDDNAEVELAYLETIPSDSSSITLITTKENLDKFIKASSYKLRTRIETKETLSEPTDIQVDMKFKVTAGLI
jgi:hypothetical protein